MRRSRIVKPKEYDTDRTAAGQCHDLAKIEIKGQNDASFSGRFLENCSIRHAVQTFIPEMRRIVSLGTKPLDNPVGYPHVSKKAHRHPLYGMHFFLGKPCGIFERLLDVVPLKVRIVRKDFVYRGPVSNLADDDGYGYAHAANARSSSHDFRIKCYSVEHMADLLYVVRVITFYHTNGLIYTINFPYFLLLCYPIQLLPPLVCLRQFFFH